MSVRDTTIPDLMTAVQCHGIRDYRVTTQSVLPATGLQPGDLLVRVTRCGICAGDAKCFAGAARFWGGLGHPRYVQTPVTPGHEFVGEVAGGEREGFAIGDVVTAEQVVACGTCVYCRRGLRWLCDPHDVFGFHTNVHGGLAEYMVFPARALVYKLRKGVAAAEAVYVEPLSCAVHAVERARVQLGDTVVVGGCGPIGLGMVAAARRSGAARVVAVDVLAHRLDVARACGADAVLRAGGDEDVVARVHEMTGGLGCDVYLEATGRPQGVVQGLQMCRKRATFVEFSVFTEETAVDWSVVGDSKELEIRGGHCSGERGYEVAIAMIDGGALPLDRIVSHALPMGDVVDGIGLVADGSRSVKVTIDPTLG